MSEEGICDYPFISEEESSDATEEYERKHRETLFKEEGGKCEWDKRKPMGFIDWKKTETTGESRRIELYVELTCNGRPLPALRGYVEEENSKLKRGQLKEVSGAKRTVYLEVCNPKRWSLIPP
jgi:hypothetical protein